MCTWTFMSEFSPFYTAVAQRRQHFDPALYFWSSCWILFCTVYIWHLWRRIGSTTYKKNTKQPQWAPLISFLVRLLSNPTDEVGPQSVGYGFIQVNLSIKFLFRVSVLRTIMSLTQRCYQILVISLGSSVVLQYRGNHNNLLIKLTSTNKFTFIFQARKFKIMFSNIYLKTFLLIVLLTFSYLTQILAVFLAKIFYFTLAEY